MGWMDRISAAVTASVSTLRNRLRPTIPTPIPSRGEPVHRFFLRPFRVHPQEVDPPTPEQSPSPILREFDLLAHLFMLMEDVQPLSEESLSSSDSFISSIDIHTPQELRHIPLITTPDEEPLSEPAPPPTPAPPPRRRSRLPVSIRRLQRPVPGPAAAVEPDEKPLSEMEDSQPLGESLSSSDSSISTIDTH
ncbi:SET-binding protein, partial [Austrofundulus limnaeus]|uniref:SET-binding protein n=1 Tax=Austrofundulus limnaeus TaxID=52670 RepID=A0A2I4CNL2_AUSLI